MLGVLYRRRSNLLIQILAVISILLSAACTSVPAPAAQAAPVATTSPAGFTILISTSTPAPSATSTPTSTPLPPSPTATSLPPTPDCLKMGGRIETGKLASPKLPDGLDYRVYLPPCYDQSRAQSYPVLYLIHGQSYTDDQWDRLGADEEMDDQVPAGGLAPFIIVMPRDRTWGQPAEDPFGEAVVSDLIPYIDSHYRTLADREHRALGGLSRGGGWAVHLGLEHWELFGTIGAHSLAVFATDTKHIRQWLDEIPHDQMPRIYLDVGNNDRPEIMSSAVWFEKLLNQKDVPHEWHLFAGYHDEKYWSSHLPGYLAWYAANW